MGFEKKNEVLIVRIREDLGKHKNTREEIAATKEAASVV